MEEQKIQGDHEMQGQPAWQPEDASLLKNAPSLYASIQFGTTEIRKGSQNFNKLLRVIELPVDFRERVKLLLSQSIEEKS